MGPPFDELLPPGAYELTYILEGSTCVTNGMFDGPFSGGPYAEFRGGTAAVYLDATPDADFANLSTFRDGDLVLLAEMSVMHVAEDDPHEACPWMPDNPDVSSFLTFAGGLWFEIVSRDGKGFEALSNGELYFNIPPVLQALGFACGIDGMIDVYEPVPTAQTTWGAVKSLYR